MEYPIFTKTPHSFSCRNRGPTWETCHGRRVGAEAQTLDATPMSGANLEASHGMENVGIAPEFSLYQNHQMKNGDREMCKMRLDISAIQESLITLPVSVFSSFDVLRQLTHGWTVPWTDVQI